MSAALLSLSLAACSQEYGVQRQERRDVFHQNRLDAIDLLLVIDNSCSMVGEQEHLALSFDDLIASLQTGQSDWRVAVTTSEASLFEYRGLLAGGTDEVVLLASDGTLIDRVAYDDRLWPIDRGIALERCDLESAEYSAFQQTDGPGTPGARNTCGPPPVTAPASAPRPPRPGELVISEFLPWSAPDGCAWVELANRTAQTLSLSGVALQDDGRDHLAFAEDSAVSPGGFYLVSTSETCDLPVDLAAGASFHLANGARWVDPGTPDAASVFSELVAVGTGAFGLEMGMENALLTLEAQADAKGRQRFLRDEADLALLFFSDEDDLSPWSVAHYTDALRALKGTEGQREPHRVRVGVAVGTEPAPPTAPSCSSERGSALYAPRYLALAEQTGGLSWSICGDLSDVATQAGLTFSDLLFQFALSAIPAVETLVVEEYGPDDAYIGPMLRDRDYTLEAREDEQGQMVVWMVFPDDRVSPETTIVITYEILPDTARLELD